MLVNASQVLRAVGTLVLVSAFPTARPFSSQSIRATKRVELDASLSAVPKYARWNEDTSGGLEMQTCVTTFKHPASGNTVELHAQLHLGDSSYFDHYNSEEFNKGKTVLYELLLDESLLQSTPAGGRTVAAPLGASAVDLQTAQQYGWSCQVESMNYQRSNWIHADLTRQEFLSKVSASEQEGDKQEDRPLWMVASKSNPMIPSLASEAATALLIGPPLLPASFRSDGNGGGTKSNPFLRQPGNVVLQPFRGLLWMALPSPELSILLLDWSTLLFNRVSGLSPIMSPMIQAMMRGRLDHIRRLAFGQVVLNGNQLAPLGDDYELLIKERNKKALEVFKEQLLRNKRGTPQTLALLYGCGHCPDLHEKLADYGYKPISTKWRTAWSVPLQQQYLQGESLTDARVATVGLLVLLPFYLSMGGWDWISTIGEVAKSESLGEISLELFLYLIRHVMLYVGASKLLLDWEAEEKGT